MVRGEEIIEPQAAFNHKNSEINGTLQIWLFPVFTKLECFECLIQNYLDKQMYTIAENIIY